MSSSLNLLMWRVVRSLTSRLCVWLTNQSALFVIKPRMIWYPSQFSGTSRCLISIAHVGSLFYDTTDGFLNSVNALPLRSCPHPVLLVWSICSISCPNGILTRFQEPNLTLSRMTDKNSSIVVRAEDVAMMIEIQMKAYRSMWKLKQTRVRLTIWVIFDSCCSFAYGSCRYLGVLSFTAGWLRFFAILAVFE